MFGHKRSSSSARCPRATGRHPLRRKKNCVWLALVCGTCFLFIQMTQFSGDFSALEVLPDAKSEAKRLLKYITHYHYQCNSTMQTGNRSHWPICVEHDTGIDVDSRDTKIAYFVGAKQDFNFERELAQNYSFEVYLIGQGSSTAKAINRTHLVDTVVVANDPADFTRNSYGQQTLNDIMKVYQTEHIDLLRIESTVNSVKMWEILHFMIQDNLLLNVRQLHIAMYIGKIEEDLLYSWYKTLHELFYKEGFRLYHTATADQLCLQVTMMQSCVYYMSWIKNPGSRVFVLHPPAHYGSQELEETRLLDYLTRVQTECKMEVIGGQSEQNSLQFTTPGQPQWQVCSKGLYQLFEQPCNVFRVRLNNDFTLEEKLLKESCSVHTLEPVESINNRKYKIHTHTPFKNSKSRQSEIRMAEEVLNFMSTQGRINLLEIDVPGREFGVLSQMLDHGILQNVTQVVMSLQIPDTSHGKHPTSLRSKYSELRRLESQGFNIFYSSENIDMDPRSLQMLGPECCFKMGFIKREIASR